MTGQPIAGLDRRQAAGETVIDLAGRRVFLVGAGKATIGMAAVVDRLLGAAPHRRRRRRQARPGAERPLRHVEVLEASHPLPDEPSLAGGLRLLGVARQARPGDLLIGLVTGGSSALAVAPADGHLAGRQDRDQQSAAGLRRRHRRHQQRAQAPLGDQRRAAGSACGCEIVNFTVSDVVGDPLDYITDLTVPDRSTWEMAQATCDRSASGSGSRQRSPNGCDAPTRPGDAEGAAGRAHLGRRRRRADVRGGGRGGAAARLRARASSASTGRARRATPAPPSRATSRRGAAAPPDRGGENTVTLPRSRPASAGRKATGRRPRANQEAALAAALELDGAGAPAAVLCLDSDGSDGPTDAAGGLVDDLSRPAARRPAWTSRPPSPPTRPTTPSRALGDLVLTGPTGTNVNDLKIGLSGR